jgi:hypothetical protein
LYASTLNRSGTTGAIPPVRQNRIVTAFMRLHFNTKARSLPARAFFHPYASIQKWSGTVT